MKSKKRGYYQAGLFILTTLFIAQFAYSQSSGRNVDPATLAAGHSGVVSVVAFDPVRNYILSAGMDGFLGIWNVRTNSAVDRFQVSPYAVRSMIQRPGKSQVALLESDGVGVYRISTWDYGLKRNLFTLRFRDPVTFINYSAGGNFLMVARSARSGVVFIHPETGEVLDSPPDQTGTIAFSATGRSERTMMTYASSGQITYWELNTGRSIQDSVAPANLTSPIIFGNNRYLSGIDSNGLIVLDAVTGREIARDRHVAKGKLFPVSSSDLLEFMYLGTLDNSTNGSITLTHYTITTQGTLEGKNRTTFSRMPLISSGVTIAAGAVALGTVDGGVWMFEVNDREPRAMGRVKLTQVSSVAISGDSLAFMTEDKHLSIIPVDYQSLMDRDTITLEDARGNTQISGDSAMGFGAPGRFLFWQTDNTRTYPILVTGAGTRERTDIILGRLALRHSLRSVSLLGNQALFVDSAGSITVLSTDTGSSKFTYAATDPLDISFLDSENIIIGHSDLSQTSPFLVVNTVTEETVPFIYPSTVGAKLYRSADGAVYGGVVEGSSNSATTALLLLNTEHPADSTRLVEYKGEDTSFIIAQSGQSVASTIGGNGPTLHSNRGFIPFERGPSLPINLIGSERYFIVLGRDGSISWHNPATGSLLARLRLLETEWILETADRHIQRGPLQR
ncbi:WD40 repeat domain-containing protein [Treponema primitia]|uniref:WD40 repeat domain-containing protein n=1 Tax=Treponema primitia TaxID=88058 RepID=UPI00397F7076